MDDFNDKVAVVTGTANPKGIGFALARQLGQAGCRIVLADLDGPGVEARAAELRAAGTEAAGGSLDTGRMGCEAAGVGVEPAATGVGAASSGLIAGGVEGSSTGSDSGRVTITESPASAAMPPTSARTSSKVTWRSAW